MGATYLIDNSRGIGLLTCDGRSVLDDLEAILAQLRSDPNLSDGLGVLLELAQESVLVHATQAVALVDLLRGAQGRSPYPLALCIPGSDGIIPGRSLAMLGRYHGLQIKAFTDQGAAARWLSDPARWLSDRGGAIQT
jgi:hypothetical protein